MTTEQKKKGRHFVAKCTVIGAVMGFIAMFAIAAFSDGFNADWTVAFAFALWFATPVGVVIGLGFALDTLDPNAQKSIGEIIGDE